MTDFTNQDGISESGVLATSAAQISWIGDTVDMYRLVEATSLGKSAIGSQMDQAGRWMFNHRFGGGHLWWRELSNRPMSEWPEVMEHLASDFFTPQGLPYLFDGESLRETDLLSKFSQSRSHDHWGMLNGFECIGGGVTLAISVYEARQPLRPYSGDLRLATDGMFIGLTFATGIASSNPLLIVAAAVRASTLIRKVGAPLQISSSSPLAVSAEELLSLPRFQTPSLDQLLNTQVLVAGASEEGRASLKMSTLFNPKLK